MDYPVFLGILLIASSTVVFVSGLYATNERLDTKINKQLIWICSALLVWALGLAITLTAANEEICLIGHVIAPIGWGLMPGLLLHFTLLLTGKNKLFKKWLIYLILYLPGLLVIYAFTILPSFGKNVDSFLKTIYGWAPVVQDDGWDYFFYAYYLIYSAVNIAILLLTRKNTRDENERAQVTILAIAFGIAYVFGTIFDLLLEHMNIIVPQLAPIFAVIAVGGIVYSVYKYRPLDPQNLNQSEIILTDNIRKNMYSLMGFIFITISIINIITKSLFYEGISSSSVTLLSLFLILIAVFLFIVNNLKINNDFKDLLVAIIYSIVIPVPILRFVQYGSTTIWAFVFLIMVICLLYNKRIMLIAVIISSIMTQSLVWVMNPAVLVEVDKGDYIARLGFIVIAAILTIYVSNIYLARLKDNSIYSKKQKLIADLSQNLISAEEQNVKERIQTLLEKSGKFIGCNGAYISLIENSLDKIACICDWQAEDKQLHFKDFLNSNPDILQKIDKHFDISEIIKIFDSTKLTPEASTLKNLFIEKDIRGFINIPIKDNNDIIGFIGFVSSNPLGEPDLYSDDFLEIFASLVSDILTRIEREKKIKSLAYYDQLTGLPNKDLFHDRLSQAIEQAKRTGNTIAVVFMDLDSFQSVNNTMGHDMGDKLLIDVGKTLSACLRNYDTVSRFGGDEFVIMINQLSDAKDVLTIMDKLIKVIHSPFNLGGQEFFITASAGVALYPQDGEDADTLIKNSDTALNRAKEMGKDRYLMCSQDMMDQILEKMQLTNHLYRALEREQFVLYYEPQINSKTQAIVGVEALLRWNLPDRGIISPAVFIPLAEQTGLINPIGEWVLETACRQRKVWKDRGLTNLRMAVNISVKQLNKTDFIQHVENILKRTGVSPQDLELEITESVLSNNRKIIIDILSDLKKIGASIAIDDFGKEYSSLSRLTKLPIDRIKMDMDFVHGIEKSEKEKAIAKVIINLAKNMNLKVIAEGVETKTQLDYLNTHKCDEIQGYYFYKPMPAEEIEKILFKS